MPIYRLNSSGQWKKFSSLYRLNNSGVWKRFSAWYRLNSSGIWKKLFSSEEGPSIAQQVEISQSTNSTTGLVTLTGTNYHWTNSTSLTYYFQWYNSGSWQTIDVGSITNPASGSSNTKTYVVQSYDTSTNSDNLYRFRVVATNIVLTSSSISNTTTISTPRDVINVTASQVGTDLQASVSFTVGSYTGSVIIKRYKYSGGTLQSTTEFYKTTASPTTITLDEYGKQYRFSVTPYTGNIVSGNVTGYPGNESSLTTQFTSNFPPTPIQTSSPTLSSTGNVVIGTTLTANRGTYQNNTIFDGNPDLAIQTRVYGWVFPGPTLTNGTTTAPPTPDTTSGGTQSLLTTQLMVNYTFYAVDIVIAADGASTYYYYSDLNARAFIPSFSDNFNRLAGTGSQGLGQTSTGSWYWSTNGGLYGPQTPSINTNNFSWQLDTEEISGRQAVVTYTNPSVGNSATNYPLKTINVGDSNVALKVSVSDGGGGPGLAFWVTSAGSWWAVAPDYSSSSSTSYSCNTPVTSYSCYTPVSVTSYTCNTPQTITTYGCGGSASTSFCPDDFTTEYNAFTVGRRCSGCSSTTSYSYSCGTDQYVSNDPGTVVACNSPSHNGQPCYKLFVGEFGIQWIVRYCSVSSTTSYSYSTVNSSTTSGCTGGPISTDASGTGCGGCTVSSSTVTTCTGGPIGTNSSGSGCGGCGVSSSTSCSGGPISTDSSGSGCGGCSVSSSTTVTYTSTIKILSSVGSTVTSQYSQTVATSNSAFIPIYGLSVETSNNTITAKAYSNTAVTNQLGSTLTATPSSPTKSIAGDSAVGIINTPTVANRITGNRLDDFVYTNV
jgi:hypothetical protein